MATDNRWLNWAKELQNLSQCALAYCKDKYDIERFERILKHENYRTLVKTLWFIQPNYEVKFHLHKMRVWPVLRALPWIRNFYTTAGYYVVGI